MPRHGRRLIQLAARGQPCLAADARDPEQLVDRYEFEQWKRPHPVRQLDDGERIVGRHVFAAAQAQRP
jgi:hypothetical protein